MEPSCGTDDALLLRQQVTLFPKRLPMAQHTAAEDQVIDIMIHSPACDLEDGTHRCPNLTWNHVFLAADRLSRSAR